MFLWYDIITRNTGVVREGINVLLLSLAFAPGYVWFSTIIYKRNKHVTKRAIFITKIINSFIPELKSIVIQSVKVDGYVGRGLLKKVLHG